MHISKFFLYKGFNIRKVIGIIPTVITLVLPVIVATTFPSLSKTEVFIYPLVVWLHCNEAAEEIP